MEEYYCGSVLFEEEVCAEWFEKNYVDNLGISRKVILFGMKDFFERMCEESTDIFDDLPFRDFIGKYRDYKIDREKNKRKCTDLSAKTGACLNMRK